MFERLKKKWKVKGPQLVLILCTFAIGGSLTGYVGKRLMNLLAVEKGVGWIFLYILLITLIWPLMVLLVSIPFGQYHFFIGYLKKIGQRIGLVKKETIIITATHRLAIFASGAGSNAQKIIDYFKANPAIANVELIVCNKKNAGVLDIAARENIPVLLAEKEKFFTGDAYLPELKAKKIDLLILAGFLWKIPVTLIHAFPQRIINIHPALLPLYGGKGMYGEQVHNAVLAAGDKESGITIHYVDEQYDHGDTILQARCAVLPGDTPATLAARIHELEHQHFAAAIAKLINEK